MASATAYPMALGSVQPRTQKQDGRTEAGWTEASLHRAVDRLYEQTCPHTGRFERRATVDAIVRLGMQPEMIEALNGRRDPGVAVKGLATRYAFEALIEQGRPIHRLDPLSQALVQATLDLIHQRARKMEAKVGENPLEEDHGLLLSICKSLARYVPRRPMGAHISWKLRHYEGATSRAMRQVENLVRRPEVTEGFVAFVLDAVIQKAEVREADGPDELKAHLLNLARGGGRSGLPYGDVIRFFARPDTVAFVKQFAGTVQTARTLYAEEEYDDVPWQGKRRLPDNRRQGYLDQALARLAQAEEYSLDSADVDFHDLLAADIPEPDVRVGSLRRESFERWVTRKALEARPDDALWQAASLLYEQGLRPEEAIVQSLADAETLAAARARVEALQADPDVWGTWMAATLG